MHIGKLSWVLVGSVLFISEGFAMDSTSGAALSSQVSASSVAYARRSIVQNSLFVGQDEKSGVNSQGQTVNQTGMGLMGSTENGEYPVEGLQVEQSVSRNAGNGGPWIEQEPGDALGNAENVQNLEDRFAAADLNEAGDGLEGLPRYGLSRTDGNNNINQIPAQAQIQFQALPFLQPDLKLEQKLPNPSVTETPKSVLTFGHPYCDFEIPQTLILDNCVPFYLVWDGSNSVWQVAQVTDIDVTGFMTQLKLHIVGRDKAYDESLSISSDRLQPLVKKLNLVSYLERVKGSEAKQLLKKVRSLPELQ